MPRQVRDGDHHEAVRLAEPDEIRDASHGAVVVDDLANHASGYRPARWARSTAASVCPRRSSTPPGQARSGKTCPGRAKSSGEVRRSTAAWIVRARSWAEM